MEWLSESDGSEIAAIAAILDAEIARQTKQLVRADSGYERLQGSIRGLEAMREALTVEWRKIHAVKA